MPLQDETLDPVLQLRVPLLRHSTAATMHVMVWGACLHEHALHVRRLVAHGHSVPVEGSKRPSTTSSGILVHQAAGIDNYSTSRTGCRLMSFVAYFLPLLTMKDGAWFPDDAAATLQLEEGVLHPDVRAMLSVKQLKATWQIREVLAANDMAKHAPQSRQIHVVVVVQRESQLEWQSAQLRPHIYDPISKYFLREKEVMGDSGLPPSHVTLYCRPAFHMQIELLREMVRRECGWGGFLVLQERERQSPPWRSLMCSEWFLQKDVVIARRLKFICSVAVRGKIRDNMDLLNGAMEYQVWSWTLDEYLDAAIDGDFSEASPNLDAVGLLVGDKSAMVRTKYYYAAGSCRYLFCFNTEQVMKKLNRAVDSLNGAAIVAATGHRSFLSVNHLFAMFKRTSGVGEMSPVVGGYAPARTGVRCDPGTIKRFMLMHQGDSNSASNGCMLEMLFFSSIRNNGLDMTDAAGDKTGNLKEAVVVVSDGIPSLPPNDSRQKNGTKGNMMLSWWIRKIATCR
ncbi:hypothetical protein ON010_g5423 [Phytophthora cinnamomi]|nr:hypothetical protein ON010_g5423 [Phytophthora cinnamomi]